MKKTISILALFPLLMAFQNCSPLINLVLSSSRSFAVTPSEYTSLQEQRAETYKNPILAESGDPHAIEHKGKYYIYLPDNKRKNGVRFGNYKVYESKDLTNWEHKGRLFAKGSFNGTMLWAPDVYYHKEDQKFYLYYTIVHETNSSLGSGQIGDKDIGVATSSSPIGPFEKVLVEGKPHIIVGANNSLSYIDPNIFRDDDGTLYMVYKYRDYGGSKIFLQKMSSPTIRTGDPTLLISSDSTDLWENTHLKNKLTWEKTVTIEQPYLTKVHGFYYLFYSANQGETENYGIGVLRSRSLDQLFVKPNQFINSPVVGKNIQGDAESSIIGPGAVAIVKDAYNRRWLVYRQKKGFEHGWDRSIHLDRIEFTRQGKIYITPTKNEEVFAPITKKQAPHATGGSPGDPP